MIFRLVWYFATKTSQFQAETDVPDSVKVGFSEGEKICWWMIYAVSSNAITSEVYKMFLWKNKQKKTTKADKIVFLMKYNFIYFAENVFPGYSMPWDSRYSGNLVIFVIYWSFLHFFCLMWLNWAPL